MKPPFRYYGGKSKIIKQLLNLVPKHHTYVEVFGGAGNLLFAKESSPIEVYNDLESGVVNFYRVLRNKKKSKELQELLELTPYSREEHDSCCDNWESQKDDIEKARQWYVAVQQSFSGKLEGGWSCDITKSSTIHNLNIKSALEVSQFVNKTFLFPDFNKRIKSVQIENLDFRKLIPKYDYEDCFFYGDPPYIADTRKESKSYKQETTDTLHKDLVSILLSIKGKAMLSGYIHDIYKPLEDAGWERIDWKVPCTVRAGQKGSKGTGSIKSDSSKHRIESVWINYPNPNQGSNLFTNRRS